VRKKGLVSVSEYYDVKRFTAVLRGQPVEFCSKRGIPNWWRVTAGTVLLADAVRTSPGARILVLGCDHGALGVALARTVPRGEVVLTDTSYIAVKMAEMTVNANRLPNVTVSSAISQLPSNANAFDAACMRLPKGRQSTRRWLLEAFLALRVDGRLYLAGPTGEGAKSAVEDMRALFGNAEVAGYRSGERAAVAVKTGPEPGIDGWTKEDGIRPGTWVEFEAELCGNRLRLRTLPGVFAHHRVDPGTRLLIENMEIPRTARVLDLGCGSGVIGVSAAEMGASHVDLVDADLCSVSAARENVVINEASNAVAFPSDLFSAVLDREYDVILSNPPFHAGKATDFSVASALVAQARQVLGPGGKLIIVSNESLGYAQQLQAAFGKVKCLRRDRGYVVLSAE